MIICMKNLPGHGLVSRVFNTSTPVATLAYFCYSCPHPALCQLQFPTRGPWTQSKSS